MATSSEDLLVRVQLDSSGAVKGINLLQSGFEKLGAGTKAAEGRFQKIEGEIGKLAFGVIGLNQGLELAKSVWEALAEPVVEVTKAYIAQQQAELNLQDALKITGQYSEGAVANFQAFATSLSDVTTFSEDTVLAVAALGKQIGLSDASTKKYISAAADLASVNGGDLKGSFLAYTDSLKGNAGALEAVAPELKKFTELQNQAGASADYLANKLKGRATVSAKDLGSQLKMLGNDFEKLKAEAGRGLSDLIGEPQMVAAARDTVKSLTKELEHLIDIAKQVKSTLQSSMDFESLKTSLKNVAIALGGFFALMNIPAILSLVAAIGAMALEWGVIAVALIGAAAAADILMRNLNRIPALLGVVGNSFKIMGQAIVRGILGWTLLLETGVIGVLEAVAGTFADVGGAATAALEHMRKQAAATSGAIDTMNESIAKTGDQIKATGKDIDTGFVGQFKNGIDALKKMKLELGDLGKSKPAPDGGKDLKVEDARKLQQIRDMITQAQQQNNQLLSDIDSVGASQIQQIQNQVAMEQDNIDLTMEKLKAEGMLTEELKRQFLIQKGLVEEKGKKQIDTIKENNLVSPDQLQAIGDTFGKATSDMMKSAGAAVGGITGPVGALMGGANAILDGIQQLIDFIPQILDKIANIFTSLTQLPLKILQGISNLAGAFLGLIQNLIPNILNAIPQILNVLISTLLEKLPDVIEQLMNSLPKLVVGFINSIVALIPRLVAGLIAAVPKILVALTVGLIKAAPQIAIALVRAMVIEIPKAIAQGIVEGIKEAISAVVNGVKSILSSSTDGVKKTIQDIGKTVSGFSDSVFKVVDMAATAQGSSVAQEIRDSIASATAHGVNLLQQAWAALKAAWTWIYDHIVKPIISGLQGVWDFVKKLFDTILGALSAIWNLVMDKVVKPLVKDLLGVWQSIVGLITGAWNAVIGFFKNLFAGNVAGAFKSIIDFFTGPFATWIKAPFKLFIDTVSNLANLDIPIFHTLANAISKLFEVPSWIKDLHVDLGGGGGGGNGGFLGQVTGGFLADGGLIAPQYAADGMFVRSPKGVDQVPVMTEAGEFVMKKSAVDHYGPDLMHALNQKAVGTAPPSAPNQTFHITLNLTATQLDDSYVRNKLVPTFMAEVKKQSLNGRFVVDAKGVRK